MARFTAKNILEGKGTGEKLLDFLQMVSRCFFIKRIYFYVDSGFIVDVTLSNNFKIFVENVAIILKMIAGDEKELRGL
jgi:hypothetical protein